MADQPIKKGRDLTPEEDIEFREGSALYELTRMPGWEVLRRWFEDRACHSWADPRETNVKEEWVWRELNAFHSADVAKQFLLDVEKAVSRAEYLGKVRSGEIKTKKFNI